MTKESTPVLRLDYTRSPGPFEYLTLEDLRALRRDPCPLCGRRVDATRIEHDIVGGKYLAYTVELCTTCGWWNAFKFWEDHTGETIYACRRSEPDVLRYDLTQKGADVSTVLRLLSRHPDDMKYLHWETFERLARRFLEDQGYHVIDIRRKHLSGADWLLFDLAGTRILAEVKHYKERPVQIRVVRHLRGVMQEKDVQLGMLLTSTTFTRDALAVMNPDVVSRVPPQNEMLPILYYDFHDFAEWLSIVELRENATIVERMRDYVLRDAMAEM
jgi:Restriction endonuclease